MLFNNVCVWRRALLKKEKRSKGRFNLISNKRTRIWETRQEANSRKLIPIQSVSDYPDHYFSHLKPSERDVLLYIINNSYRLPELWMSQSTIARKTGYCREVVNRALGKFHEDGLIYSHYRHMRTNTYRLGDFVKTDKIRTLLARLMPAVFSFFILLCPTRSAMMGSISRSLMQRQVTQSNEYIRNKERYCLSNDNVTSKNPVPPTGFRKIGAFLSVGNTPTPIKKDNHSEIDPNHPTLLALKARFASWKEPTTNNGKDLL